MRSFTFAGPLRGDRIAALCLAIGAVMRVMWGLDIHPPGEAIMLAHLACAVPLAILIFGDPRFRSVYDIFGFALLAALLVDRFKLDRPAAAGVPGDAS